ncbi:uncharacterized protein B0H64DRAFT_49513 [Chaetomium fimeti]|uniref:Uncharacterized protein n=1 Tax=Chaetomium fimeti TaxID=1854472 RepID=A0AAE0H733_9PEZI|nr:hypothetical protein B0H64DRAFT_49513 [Chaetomium fimeti]
MCWYKRVRWGCDCIHGVILWNRCPHRGTPQCQKRHLLERYPVQRACNTHLTDPRLLDAITGNSTPATNDTTTTDANNNTTSPPSGSSSRRRGDGRRRRTSGLVIRRHPGPRWGII